MNIYLAIITTALVLTQIIRLIQNTIQLKNQIELDKKNLRVMEVWDKLEQAIDIYLEKEV